ncbi:MAG: sortase [Clostridia bacterium]
MAKRYKERKSNKKIVITILAILLIIVGMVIIIKFFYKNETNIQQVSSGKINNIEPEQVIEKEPIETGKQNIDNIKQISGYKVIGRIKISKINLEDVILEKTTDTSLNSGLTKLWGPEMNEIGNFSITGHNYKISRSPLFSQLDKIGIGDTFELKDLKNRTVTYKVYKKFKSQPEDTTPIDQNKDGKREVTLITCTKGAIERIIFKAREI